MATQINKFASFCREYQEMVDKYKDNVYNPWHKLHSDADYKVFELKKVEKEAVKAFLEVKKTSNGDKKAIDPFFARMKRAEREVELALKKLREIGRNKPTRDEMDFKKSPNYIARWDFLNQRIDLRALIAEGEMCVREDEVDGGYSTLKGLCEFINLTDDATASIRREDGFGFLTVIERVNNSKTPIQMWVSTVAKVVRKLDRTGSLPSKEDIELCRAPVELVGAYSAEMLGEDGTYLLAVLSRIANDVSIMHDLEPLFKRYGYSDQVYVRKGGVIIHISGHECPAPAGVISDTSTLHYFLTHTKAEISFRKELIYEYERWHKDVENVRFSRQISGQTDAQAKESFDFDLFGKETEEHTVTFSESSYVKPRFIDCGEAEATHVYGIEMKGIYSSPEDGVIKRTHINI